MVILLQLCILLVAVAWRGRFLFGRHLAPANSGADDLTWSGRLGLAVTAKHIGRAQRDGVPFIIRREAWYHRALKALGFASEISLDNPSLDRRLFIATDYPGQLEQLLASGDLRHLLEKLFSLPVESLHATPGKIWCVIGKQDVSRPYDYFAVHLALLREISAATRASRVRGNGLAASSRRGQAAAIAVLVHAGLLTLGILGALSIFAGSIDMFDRQALITAGAIAGAVAAWFWFLGLMYNFSGSSWAPWVAFDFFLCGIIGIVLSGILFVWEANIRLPQDVARVHNLPVLSKMCILECTRAGGKGRMRTQTYLFDTERDCTPHSRESIRASKRQTDSVCASHATVVYQVEIKHWRQPGSYHFRPSAEVFDSLSARSVLQLPVHEGAFGFEWVDTGQFLRR